LKVAYLSDKVLTLQGKGPKRVRRAKYGKPRAAIVACTVLSGEGLRNPTYRYRRMPKQQKTYTLEFKLEAVRLAKSSGKSLSQIVGESGISDSALYHWSKQFFGQEVERMRQEP